MGEFYVSQDSLRNLKARIGRDLPTIPSSHLSEALAAALGMRTHAALKALLANAPTAAVAVPSEERFVRRARDLGHGAALLQWRGLPSVPNGREKPKRNIGKRAKAWRNMMVAAINSGLEQHLFGLGPEENFWLAKDSSDTGRGPVRRFEFTFGPGIPALAAVNDAGFGELGIHVALNPRDRNAVGAAFAGRSAGEAYAEGWLERTLGVWLQTEGGPTFSASRALTEIAAAADMEPLGFSDHGKLMM